MLSLYKYALGPILLIQGRAVRRNAIRLPEPAGNRTGTTDSSYSTVEPLRLLFVGDSSAAGVGVETQGEALASRAASCLSDKTGIPVEWQLLAKSGVNTAETLQMLSSHELRPADLVVTALGVNDVTSQRSASQFLADYKELVARLRASVGAQAAIINGVPPMHILPSVPQPLRWFLGQCANRLDSRLRAWVQSQSPEAMAYLSLQWAAKPNEMARDGYHPGAGQYRLWAEMVAEHAARLLAPRIARREI